MLKDVNWNSILPVKGVKLGTAAAGIKYENREDLLLVSFCDGAHVSGVFTQNAFAAAPIAICRQHLDTGNARAFVINSGNANACTGQEGVDSANAICRAAADLEGVEAHQVLPFSTGVIGELLPTEKIITALSVAHSNLAEQNWEAAAKAIMTTDTKPKACSKTVSWQGADITITGIAKGAGMINPNMGTMLAYIATDAAVSESVLDIISRSASNKSFNRITIDGDTSTNDSCMLIASGQADVPELTESSGEYFDLLNSAITDIYEDLAKAIVLDGEGATKFVEVCVKGGATSQESLDVAYEIAHSPLVKTAMFASDPNWGRIVMAIGNSGVFNLNASQIKVWLDDVLIVEGGGRAASYTEEQGQAVFDQDSFTIKVDLSRGHFMERIWTSDLSHEYVRINAEYRS